MDVIAGILLITVIILATLLVSANRPLQIKVIHEHVYPEVEDPLEEPDQKTNAFYQDYSKTISNLTDVFGGANESTR